MDGERPTQCIIDTDEVRYLMQEIGLQIAWREDQLWKGVASSVVDMANENYRYHAYRKYIRFIHGRLGRHRRRVIPSCVVRSIRTLWPSPDGQYAGYSNAQSAEATLDSSI